MRDAFGEIDPDEIDIIDFIEPDANAFDAHGDPDPPSPRIRRRWIVPTAIAGAVGLAAAGLIAWSPWRDDDTQSFPAGEAPALTLTGELVFDEPPAELTVASVGAVSADDGLFDLGDAAGYFFAEGGARWLFTDGASGGRWAGFFAVSEALGIVTMDAGAEATTATVQGVPALIDAQRGDVRAVRFGPIDGRIFSVVTGGMSLADTLAFAEATGVNDGVPTLANDNVLGGMRPIGDMADYQTTVATMFAALSSFGAQPDIVSLHYGDNAFNIGDATPQYSLASQPTSGDTTLEMLRFMAGGVDGPAVHGQASIVADEVALGFGAGSKPSSLAAWVEGGRLIVVTGPQELEATLALAESVRPATDDEWAQVVEVSHNSVDPSIPLFPESPPTSV